MSMSEYFKGRRNFLKGIASAVALSSLAAKKSEAALAYDHTKISVLLGPSFDGWAEFSIVHAQPGKLRYIVYQGPDLLQELDYSSIHSGTDRFRIDKFLAYSLPIDADLVLKIYSDQMLLDERIFSSISSKRADYKIGLLSCMRAAYQDSDIWKSLNAQKSDLLLFLGDNVYVDHQENGPITPKIIWEKFVETRMVLDFYKWKRLVPTIAIWDDHDFGGDDTDKSFPFINETQQNFKNFFAQNLSEGGFITPGPGISCHFRLGNQLFLMLDGRSFRDNPKSSFIYSMFGKEQEDWIFRSIANFDGLIWLCNGTQWFNNKGYGESFRKTHTINFNVFIEKLNHINKKVVFASGDVHFSEVCETPSFVNNRSLELTSSCMHSSHFFGSPSFSTTENRIASTWMLNYLICSTQQSLNALDLDVKSFNRNKRKLFTVEMKFNLTPGG
jgi:alkaline phosphatase D